MNSLHILTQLLGQPKKLTKKDEYLFHCPFCSHHKYKLQFNSVEEYMHCWTCNASFRTLNGFIKKAFPHRTDLIVYNNTKKGRSNVNEYINDYEEIITPRKLALPNNYSPLTQKSSNPDNNVAIRYLLNRGLHWKHIDRYQIGISKNKDELRLIIPSFNKKNELNYFISRAIYGSEIKYRNPSINRSAIIPFESTIDFNYSITLVEGIFDAMKINHNAIPLLGCSLGESWLLFKKILQYTNKDKNVYICLDNDKAGIVGSIQIAKLLLKSDISAYYIDISPFKDVGEMNKRDFLSMRKNAERINDYWITEKEMLLC